MAVRDTFVTVSDGDQLDDGYFNEIYTRIGRQVETPGNISHTGDTDWTDKATFTLDAANTNLLIGFFITGDIDSSDAAGVGSVRFVLTGTNLGTLYFHARSLEDASPPSAYHVARLGFNTLTPDPDMKRTGTSPLKIFVNMNPMLKLLDATTTFKIQLHTANGAHTVAFDNIEVNFLWVTTWTGD